MQHHSTDSPYIIEFSPALAGNGSSLKQFRVAVKDLFDIASYPTTAGNPDWANTHPIPHFTSPVVSALQNAGASIVGKTITDELAYSLNGQNIHFGTPLNPRNAERLPGGSSSGSAIAVAQGSADIGLGTDTGGSIRVPASYNGLYGLRPSHGVVSTEHLVGLAPSFDTVGWMTRDIHTLNAVAKVLLADLPAVSINKPIKVAYSASINAQSSQHAELAQLLVTLQKLEKIDVLDLSSILTPADLQQGAEAFRILQGAEIWSTHGEWITTCQPTFAPDIASRFAWCSTITPAQQLEALKIQQQFNLKLKPLFEQADCLLIPTTPGSAPLLTMNDDELAHYRNTLLSMTCIAGLGGLPQLQLPLSGKNDAPVGVSLIGAKYHDQFLIDFAHTVLESII